MNLAERIKKQTDKVLRQQAQGPNAGVVVVVNAGDGTATVSNPSADLAKHKQSGDHDGRYYTESEVDAFIAAKPDDFLELPDTPETYTGAAGKVPAVKSSEDGLEFIDLEESGATAFTDLDDVPASYSAQQGKFVRVKSTENGLEFVTVSPGSGASAFTELSDAPSAYTGQGGKILAVNSAENALEFITAPSGGGGYVNPIDEPPASPSAWDDEFDGSTLDPKWSWVNQGTATAAIDNGAVILDVPTGSDQTRGIIQTAPVGNFVMTAKVSLEAVIGNYYAFGIGLFNSANNRLLQIGRRNANGYVGLWVNKGTSTAFSAETLFSGYGGGYVYLKIEVSGTNIILSYSHTGKVWITILTEAITTYIGAITGIGLMAFRNNTTATNKHFGVCEWFRVTE